MNRGGEMDYSQIEDWIALTELKANYFRFLDTKQWDRWRDLFTDDMVFYSDETPVPKTAEPMTRSTDAFVATVSSMLAGSITVHQGHMPEITFTDDRNAAGIWAMYDWVDAPGESGWNNQGFGHYHERYVKGSDDRWRIAELRLTRLRVDEAGPTRPLHGARPASWSA